ncbi:methylenetetrahydrofolate reductase [Halomonas garicola]|uniref:methylenetetrahydrofolate reductase n=1 Tax=Halomonas garicola TaxID=1690008 RepID=UPI00289CD4E9|nr:methylenetetrahydrofolate reductase [Halomonas garicola]
MKEPLKAEVREATASEPPIGRCAALADPRFELLPLSEMREAARRLPTGARVTVTCSPRHGIDRTLEAAEWLAAAGFRAVPHLAARLIRNKSQLADIVSRLAAAGIEDAFVVGGDASEAAGEYTGGLALLEALAAMPSRPSRLGVPAYPEGHPRLDDAVLQRDLEAKARLADYAVTQMCFESAPLLAWLAAQRQRGLTLPVQAGIPGVMSQARLLSVAIRIGLGPSIRALGRHRTLIGRLLRPAPYRPDDLVRDLLPTLGSADGFAGLHVYTFNQTDATCAWLEGLRATHCQNRDSAIAGQRP